MFNNIMMGHYACEPHAALWLNDEQTTTSPYRLERIEQAFKRIPTTTPTNIPDIQKRRKFERQTGYKYTIIDGKAYLTNLLYIITRKLHKGYKMTINDDGVVYIVSNIGIGMVEPVTQEEDREDEYKKFSIDIYKDNFGRYYTSTPCSVTYYKEATEYNEGGPLANGISWYDIKNSKPVDIPDIKKVHNSEYVMINNSVFAVKQLLKLDKNAIFTITEGDTPTLYFHDADKEGCLLGCVVDKATRHKLEQRR